METFRNPNGVYMTIQNFKSIDPDYSGVGLQRGNKLEKPLWIEFENDKQRLADIADAIKENFNEAKYTSLDIPFEDIDEYEFPEGMILQRVHRQRERNQKLVLKKKEKCFNENGYLACEACGFDFYKIYGDAGKGLIECHHLIPVSELKKGSKTRLSDIALLCSNCHRVIHRKRPWLRLGEIRSILASEPI